MLFKKRKPEPETKEILKDVTDNYVNDHQVFNEYFTNVLEDNMNITNKVDSKINGKLGSMINKVMSTIHISIKGIVVQMVSVSKAAFNMGYSVDTLKDSLEEQNRIISGISDSTKLLSSDINDISEKTRTLTEKSLEAIDKTKSGTSRIEDFNKELQNVGTEITGTKKFMGTLKESTESINTLIDMINDITSRLDILSINASIEAARAGSAGGWFFSYC